MVFRIETKLDMGFRIMRLMDNHLIASNCNFTVNLDIIGDPSTTRAKDRISAMKLWVQSFVDGCLAYDVHTEFDTSLLEDIGNHIMMCPGDPHDYLLLTMMHAKMRAIAGADVVVNSSALIADTGEGFSNVVHGESNDVLPKMEEWVGPRSFWDTPWWNRADSSMLDIPAEPDEDLNNKPDIGCDLLELLSIDLPDDIEKPSAEIIKPQFKPRVIDGID